MTSKPGSPRIIRRHFVAIATSDYEDLSLERLDVEDEVRALHDWLCAERLDDRRFGQSYPHLAGSPSEDAIRAALKNPLLVSAGVGRMPPSFLLPDMGSSLTAVIG